MKDTEKIVVCFQDGECRNPIEGSCNYMLATDDEGDEIELYAEVATEGTPFDDYDPETEDFDFDGFDDYSSPILKAEIIHQAIKNGISPEKPKFWRDQTENLANETEGEIIFSSRHMGGPMQQ